MTSSVQRTNTIQKLPLEVMAESCLQYLSKKDLRIIALVSKYFLSGTLLNRTHSSEIEHTRSGVLGIYLDVMFRTIRCNRDGEIGVSAAFSPDGRWIVSGSSDKPIHIWNRETGALVNTLTGHRQLVRSVAFSPDGKWIVSGSDDQTINIWNRETGALVNTLTGHRNAIQSVAFSPDGKWIVSGSCDTTMKLWNRETGALVNTLTGHTQILTSVAFSPDGKWIVSGSYDQTIKLWDKETGAPVNTLTGHTRLVQSVAFSPDGKWIVSGSCDDTIKLWNRETGALINTLTGHRNAIQSVAFSPDGKWIVSGSYDKTIKLWDRETGALIKTLRGHTDLVQSVAFNPDGNSIVATYHDRTIEFWHIQTTIEEEICQIIFNSKIHNLLPHNPMLQNLLRTIETQGYETYLQKHAIWETRMFIEHYLRIGSPSLLAPYLNARFKQIRTTFPPSINKSTRRAILSLVEELQLSDAERTQLLENLQDEIQLIQNFEYLRLNRDSERT